MKRMCPLLLPVIVACAGPPGSANNDARDPFDPVGPGADDSRPNDDGYVPRVGVAAPGSEPSVSGPEIPPWFEELETPVIDCAAIPAKPTSITLLLAPRAWHDVIFDTEGNLIGSYQNNLIASQYPNDSSIWVPGVGYVEGLDWLPDGDMVAVRQYDIARINPSTGASVITSAISQTYSSAYGLVVGPDGMVYVGGNQRIMKLDPETGLAEEWIEGGARVLEFSPDYSRMYFANGSDLFVIDLDDELQPIGDARVFVEGLGSLFDAMGVDVCGNVYVSDYGSRTFFRITPRGDVTVLDGGKSDIYNHIHGLDWGSGLNEWRADAIYVAWPYSDSRVAEIVVGVPSRKYEGRYRLVNAEE